MSTEKLKLLFETIAETNNILILPHNDPDPDAVASALALRFLLAEKLDIEGKIAYHGIIGRAENKALVDYLGQPLLPLAELELPQFSTIALVDTQPGAGNNALPPDSTAAIVVDHHPWREATASANFSDVRTEMGSTSAILTEYLQAAKLEPNRQLATALFYGIKTDTMGLTRQAGPGDAAAYLYLHARIDTDALIDIERAQVALGYFKSFDTALRAARVYDQIIFSYLGPMAYPDLAAELADVLLRLEGSEWVICLGVYQADLILAVRTRNRLGGAGRLAQDVVGKQGIAGGHGNMAGGLVPLRGREPKRLAGRIRRRALHYLNVAPDTRGVTLV